jgi:glycosyltransferase involved in cell wall biosynthesis
MNPLLSILLPTYNRMKLLPRAIRSVQSQSFKEWELLIIDDGSDDNTREDVEHLLKTDSRLHLLQEEHKGQEQARALGLAHSQGEIITFIDSDDSYAPEHLKLQMDFLTKHPEADILFGTPTVLGDPWFTDVNDNSRKIHIEDCSCQGTFFVRRKVFEKVPLPTDKHYAEDYFFYEAVKSAGFLVQKIQMPTYIYDRTSPDSLTKQAPISTEKRFSHVKSRVGDEERSQYVNGVV